MCGTPRYRIDGWGWSSESTVYKVSTVGGITGINFMKSQDNNPAGGTRGAELEFLNNPWGLGTE